MKLFQIEEPDGTPDEAAPGAAVGIDLAAGAVAFAVGGNAELLGRADEAEPAARLRALKGAAEKALARPVTHAVIVCARPDDALCAADAGIAVLRVLSPNEADALAAAVAAEDLQPRT